MADKESSATRTNLQLDGVEGVFFSHSAKAEAAKRLYDAYRSNQVTGVTRNFAYCRICREQCIYLPEDDPLTSCLIRIASAASIVLVPVEMIHRLLLHDGPFDARLVDILFPDIPILGRGMIPDLPTTQPPRLPGR